MGLVTLAAFALLLRPYRAIAEPDTQIGGGTDLTRTLKLDNKSAEWDAIVEKLSIQRQIQEEKKHEEERIAAEVARKKAEAEAIAAKAKAEEAARQKAVLPTAPVSLPSGSHEDWMRQAGIAENNFSCANVLITAESGWQVTVGNKQGSGAYGLGQALPASKMAPWGADYLTNPVTQLKWMNVYVQKYGGWCQAWTFWQRTDPRPYPGHWY